MLNQVLFQKELDAFSSIRPGHAVSWFEQQPSRSLSEITCVSCGAGGSVSIFSGPLGLIFVAECTEVRNNLELQALVH